MAKGDAVSSLETPVRDGGAQASRSLHNDAERDFLASLDRGADDIALASIGKVGLAERAGIVDVQHVVASHESYAAACRPRIWTRVEESPYLDKLLASRDLGAVNDSITNEVSIDSLAAWLALHYGRLLLCRVSTQIIIRVA